jgi:hypothetical protein
MRSAARLVWSRKCGVSCTVKHSSCERILTVSRESSKPEVCLEDQESLLMKSLFVAFAVTGMMMSAANLAQADDIQQRKENQQQRIGSGVKNGSLTPHETANLEHKEAALNRETRWDRRQNGGNLTNKEKAQVNRQQNRLSRDIYRDKHNAAHQ